MDAVSVQRVAGIWQWGVLVAFFLGVAVWETWQPRRTHNWPTGRRWTVHAVLFVIALLGVPLILRATPVAAAASLELAHHGGLIANLRALPGAAAFALAFLLFDLTQYLVHRAMHLVPALWRVHEIHHSDPDFDVATGTRFHPLEVLTATAAQLAVVLLFAPPAWAVLGSQLIAMAVNFLSHGNIALPRSVEGTLRTAFVTPDLHRIHHSSDSRDYSRNFGQALAIWDRALGTLLEAPAAGLDKMQTGVPEVSGEESLRLPYLLLRPFRGTGSVESKSEQRVAGAGQ